jgi:aarF domain-containing kinase
LKSPRERRRVAIVATLVFIAGAGALAFSEQARHAYVACERSGRVGVTLAICVNE